MGEGQTSDPQSYAMSSRVEAGGVIHPSIRCQPLADHTRPIAARWSETQIRYHTACTALCRENPWSLQERQQRPSARHPCGKEISGDHYY